MNAATNVPIEHCRVRHPVKTSERTELRPFQRWVEDQAQRTGSTGCKDYTLLELVEVIAEVTDDDREVVATVLHMLASGRIKLCGNFRNEPIEAFQIESAEVAIPG